MKRKEVKEKISSLIGNSIKLALLLIFLSFLGGGVKNSELRLFNIKIPLKLIVDAIRLVAIAFFGQKILIGLLFLLNIVSDRLSKALGLEKTSGLRRIGNDIIYIIGLLLAWFGLSPLMSFLPSWVSLVFSVLFLIIASIIVYDALKTGYNLFKEKFEAFVSKLTSFITGIPEEKEKESN